MRSKIRATYPTHPFTGVNAERQSIGLPGHCERCAEVGHVRAHRNLGCGDVGCEKAHGDAEEAAAQAASTTTPAETPLRSQWTALYELLIKDVADYREAAGTYGRSGDVEGVRRANAKAAAVTKVMDYMGELERAAMIRPPAEPRMTTRNGEQIDARRSTP